jgi:transposase InsO family protein
MAATYALRFARRHAAQHERAGRDPGRRRPPPGRVRTRSGWSSLLCPGTRGRQCLSLAAEADHVEILGDNLVRLPLELVDRVGVSVDFFTVPTARLRVLFVFVVLAHDRRRVLHFNVTEHPTAAWTTQQIVDAFPDDSAPAYLLRDRDSVYGHVFRQRLKGMGVGEVLTAPHSPWQNPFAERLIGSIRRECVDHIVVDHIVVLGEQHLRRTLARYFAYYPGARTHLSLDKDAPHGRPIERPELGRIIPIREVGGGLHHRYTRRAA